MVFDGGEWIIYRDYEKVPFIIIEDVWNRFNEVIRMKKILI